MKSLLLIIPCILFSVNLSAQSWCPPGATWHYEYQMGIAGIAGVAEYKYTGDEMVNGISCKKIVGKFTGTVIPQSGFTQTVIPNWAVYHTYESNKVEYFYNGATFDTVVNFNAVPGDKWLAMQGPLNMCNAHKAVVVTDTGHKVINGFNLKTITTTYTNTVSHSGSPTPVVITNTFVERFNFQPGGLFMFYCDQDDTHTDYAIQHFRCYQDNVFPVYNVSNVTCDNITGIKETSISGEITVFPNPAISEINIESVNHSNPVTVCSLADVTGRKIFVKSVYEGKCTLDLDAIPRGIYIITVTLANGNQLVKKISRD